MFRRTLVPTDFSAPSDAALEYARLFAGVWGGALHIMHVTGDRLTPPHGSGDPGPEPAALRQIRDRLRDEDRRHRLKIRVVERAAPAEAILGYARNAEVDLIVMGTHGRRGVAHALVGSVAEKVVRSAPCPVLTMREAPATGTTGFKRILVATDFSAPSDAALDYARALALRFGASIHLVHVFEDPPLNGPFGSEARSIRFEDARERLSHRVTAYERHKRRVTTEVLLGAVAPTIVDYAADIGFDLIVMGTHGRTGIAHVMTGSVAERVVRTAACPVLTTHAMRAGIEIPLPTTAKVALTA
jgi:nucleotide-binding universal stress UspA family protein